MVVVGGFFCLSGTITSISIARIEGEGGENKLLSDEHPYKWAAQQLSHKDMGDPIILK